MVAGDIAEAEVDVRRGAITSVRPQLSSGVLTVRYAPPDAAPRLRDVERLLHQGEAGRDEWQRLGFLDVSREVPGELRLEGLLPGLVRLRLEAPGYERVRTEPVMVGGEGEARTPVVRLTPSGAAGREP